MEIFLKLRFWMWLRKHPEVDAVADVEGLSEEEKYQLWKWAREHQKNNVNVVADTNVILLENDRKKLIFLSVRLPVAVWQQVERKAARQATCDEDEAIKKAVIIMRQMAVTGRWKIAGSAGTGIVKELSQKRIFDLSPAAQGKLAGLFHRRHKSLDSDKTLGKMVGSSDMRVLATCVHLQEEFPGPGSVVLITRDKTLALIAGGLRRDLRVIEDIENL